MPIFQGPRGPVHLSPEQHEELRAKLARYGRTVEQHFEEMSRLPSMSLADFLDKITEDARKAREKEAEK